MLTKLFELFKVDDMGGIVVVTPEVHDNMCHGVMKGKGAICPAVDIDFCQPERMSETVVIYHEGAHMIAQDKSTGIKAQIEFTPADKHNFYIGAKEVLDRLARKIQAAANGEPINEGDAVEVMNNGRAYTNYKDWSGLKEMSSHFVKNRPPKEKQIYKVLKIKKHDKSKDLLALIQDPCTTQVFIIGIDGLRKTEEEKPWEI